MSNKTLEVQLDKLTYGGDALGRLADPLTGASADMVLFIAASENLRDMRVNDYTAALEMRLSQPAGL